MVELKAYERLKVCLPDKVLTTTALVAPKRVSMNRGSKAEVQIEMTR